VAATTSFAACCKQLPIVALAATSTANNKPTVQQNGWLPATTADFAKAGSE